MKMRAFLPILHNFWRWAVSYNAREMLSISVDQIVRDNDIDPDAFNAAFTDHLTYMEMCRHDPNGKGKASEFYSQIIDACSLDVLNLARCASLLRHGLFTGRLSAANYDVTQALCETIDGGTVLRPLLSKINRVTRWAS